MPGMMIMMTNIIGGYRLYDYMISTDFFKNYIITINSRLRVIEHNYMQFSLKGNMCHIHLLHDNDKNDIVLILE